MSRISSDDKHARIERVYLHLRKYPEGLKSSEIAEQLRLERKSVDNYLRELDTQGRLYKEGPRWCVMPYNAITLRPVELAAEEAMVLYLASRLFVKQSDKRNITAENVLMKLAEILSTDAGLGQDIANAAAELSQRPLQDGYEDIFRAIMRGYLHRRKVRIVYHPYRGERFQTTISPYLLEPSAIGFSTYVIGYSSAARDLRTYKMERIESAEIAHGDAYQIPANFPGLSLLQSAWSIYYGEETTPIVLRFHPDVARRVHETHWHPSQRPVADDPEKPGYVLLKFEVADTTDLKPWIRTWGANCEVLEPTELRDEMRGEARRFAELYGWETHRGQSDDDDDPLGLDTTFKDFFG
jgi:predicted DNA-binding transcriptional regulator YafY